MFFFSCTSSPPDQKAALDYATMQLQVLRLIPERFEFLRCIMIKSFRMHWGGGTVPCPLCSWQLTTLESATCQSACRPCKVRPWGTTVWGFFVLLCDVRWQRLRSSAALQSRMPAVDNHGGWQGRRTVAAASSRWWNYKQQMDQSPISPFEESIFSFCLIFLFPAAFPHTLPHQIQFKNISLSIKQYQTEATD